MTRNEALKKISNLTMQLNVERQLVRDLLAAIGAVTGLAAQHEAFKKKIERKRTGK